MTFSVEVTNESALGVQGLPPTSTNIHRIYGAVSSHNNNVFSMDCYVAACRLKSKKVMSKREDIIQNPRLFLAFFHLRSYPFEKIHV